MAYDCEFIEFVWLPTFAESVERLLDEGARQELELLLLEDPLRGDLMRDTGGFRRLEAPASSGSSRERVGVVYYYVPHRERIYLVLAYPGRGKEDLTEVERRRIRELSEIINRERDR